VQLLAEHRVATMHRSGTIEGLAKNPGLMLGGGFVSGRSRPMAVEINRLLLRREPAEERAFGISSHLQVLKRGFK
jgi:hypothetical protein